MRGIPAIIFRVVFGSPMLGPYSGRPRADIKALQQSLPKLIMENRSKIHPRRVRGAAANSDSSQNYGSNSNANARENNNNDHVLIMETHRETPRGAPLGDKNSPRPS